MTHEQIIRAVWLFGAIFAVLFVMIFLIDSKLFRPKPEETDANEFIEHESDAP